MRSLSTNHLRMLRSRSSCLAAGAAGHRAGVEHYRRPPALVEAGQGVLEPGPVAPAGGDAAPGAEAVEGIVGEEIRAEGLVPHGIGDYDVVVGNLTGCGFELGVDHGVAAGDFRTSMSWMMAFMWATA